MKSRTRHGLSRNRLSILVLGVLGLSLLVVEAQAAPVQLLSLELYPTIHSVGVEVSFQGDGERKTVSGVKYREKGTQAWIQGHLLSRTLDDRFTGSLFFLSSNTTYEVSVSVFDPLQPADTVEQLGEVTTRVDVPTPHSGRTIWVSPIGKDGANGSQEAPLRRITEALTLAEAGDLVRVMAGVYRESVDVPKSGTADKPIWIKADAGAILDGSDPVLANDPSWTLESDNIYWTAFDAETNYLAVDDTRIYDYQSLADLKNETGGQSGKTGVLKGGFFVDSAQKRLYLRLPDGSSPQGKKVYAAVLHHAFLVDNREHIVIEGFEIRYFGGQYAVGIDLRGASHVWVRKNKLHHLIAGIRTRKGGMENVIEDNQIRDTSVYIWPWASVKAHTGEASGISLSGGRGDIARYNRVEGLFNGIYTGQFGTTDLSIARDIDVYGNTILKIGDDGLEPEGACVNQRFWENTIVGVHNAISLAPIETGPAWFIRTVIRDYRAHALKINNAPNGFMFVYHTTALPGDDPGAQALAPSVPFGNLVMRNNIWVGNRYVIEYTDSSLTGPVDIDFDNLWSTNLDGNPRFVKWLDERYSDLATLTAGTGLLANGYSVKPEFLDEKGGNLRLVEGHTLIDKGQRLPGINHTNANNEPDIGAFERGGTSTPPIPDTVTPDLATDQALGVDQSPVTDGGSTGGDSGGGGCAVQVPASPSLPFGVALILLGLIVAWRRFRPVRA